MKPLTDKTIEEASKVSSEVSLEKATKLCEQLKTFKSFNSVLNMNMALLAFIPKEKLFSSTFQTALEIGWQLRAMDVDIYSSEAEAEDIKFLEDLFNKDPQI